MHKVRNKMPIASSAVRVHAPAALMLSEADKAIVRAGLSLLVQAKFLDKIVEKANQLGFSLVRDDTARRARLVSIQFRGVEVAVLLLRMMTQIELSIEAAAALRSKNLQEWILVPLLDVADDQVSNILSANVNQLQDRLKQLTRFGEHLQTENALKSQIIASNVSQMETLRDKVNELRRKLAEASKIKSPGKKKKQSK